MKQTLFGAAALAVGATFALTSCQSDEFAQEQMGEGRHVKMSVSLGFNPDETRTTLTEEDGNLKCTWNDGDKVWVMDFDGGKLGELTIRPGFDGKEYAEFEGELLINDPDMSQVTFVYFGSNVNPKEIEYVTSSGKKYWEFNFANEGGDLASLSEQDFLWSATDIEIMGGTAYTEEMGLSRHISFGHFELVFPEGVTRTDEPVTVSGEGVKNYIRLLQNGGGISMGGDDTITVAGSGNDIYMTILPNTIAPTFSVTIGGKTYTGSLGARTFKPSEFVRKGQGVGVPVVMEVEEPEDPDNPGNTGNWAKPGDALDPSYVDNGVKFVAQVDGWTLNWSSVHQYGGFGTYITYNHNGIVNGLMTSKGGTGVYFQWGRWMGLPTTCGNLTLNSAGSYSGDYKANSQLPLGVNYYNTSIGYIFGNHLSAAHGKVYMGSTSWTPLRANRSSIMFGMVDAMQGHGDYVGANEVCKWEDRSGNPAPAGYRIPTADELSVLVPSCGTFSGTYAEVKTVNGTKYAYQWKVTQSGNSSTPGKVEIRSFATKETTVSADDSRFDNVTPVILTASGYLNNLGQQQGYGTLAIYWSSDSGKVGSYNGGQYLELSVEGNKCTLEMSTVYRSFGGFVLLIKDETAKPTPLTPWFPLTGIGIGQI